MEKKVREIRMYKTNGTFRDVYQLHKWLGDISTESAGHRFDIQVSIVETKKEEE